MKLWVIPWEYDYHEQAALVIMAEDRESALRAGQQWFADEKPSNYRGKPKWDQVKEHDGPVYENEGCDC